VRVYGAESDVFMTFRPFFYSKALMAFLGYFLTPQIVFASASGSGPKLPQLDVQTYASQIFWLIISFIVLYLLVAKVAMPRISEVLEERQERIEDDLDKADTLKKEAYVVRAEYEKALMLARERAHDVIQQAKEEINRRGVEAEAIASKKMSKMLKEAEDRIGSARAEIIKGADAAADTIEKSVARTVVADTVRKMIGVDVSGEDVDRAIMAAMEEQVR
jgi:F-type H+-transporting ATPase subunit b